MINCIEKVKLAPNGQLALNNADLQEYLVLSTIKLDGRQEEESFCSSQLCIYQIPTPDAP
jgi:hypothetical protein